MFSIDVDNITNCGQLCEETYIFRDKLRKLNFLKSQAHCVSLQFRTCLQKSWAFLVSFGEKSRGRNTFFYQSLHSKQELNTFINTVFARWWVQCNSAPRSYSEGRNVTAAALRLALRREAGANCCPAGRPALAQAAGPPAVPRAPCVPKPARGLGKRQAPTWGSGDAEVLAAHEIRGVQPRTRCPGTAATPTRCGLPSS